MPFANWPNSAIYFEFFLYIIVVVFVVFIWRGGMTLRVLGIIGLFVILWAGFIEPSFLMTRENIIQNKKLSGLRIGVVSDIHVGPYSSSHKIRRIVDKFNKAKVDVVLIPGDFLYGKASYFADELSILSELAMPWYFTLGNHDHYCDGYDTGAELLLEKLASFNGIELNNSSIQLSEKKIWLAGVDDNYLGLDDLAAAFSDLPADATIILLAHSPDIIRQKESLRASFIVSGHTHGGQIRMPWGIIPFVVPVREKNYDRGYFPEKKILVSSGLGEVGTRARLFNPPEIRIISFK